MIQLVVGVMKNVISDWVIKKYPSALARPKDFDFCACLLA